MLVQPYLDFDGRCDEAIEFYKTAVGAKLDFLMRFKECPEPHQIPPGAENKVMHSTLRFGESILMASDGRCKGKPTFSGVSLSLVAVDGIEAERFFNALAVGGKVHMPMAKTFFSSKFGMVTDRFGVSWMVLVQHGK